MTSAPAAVAEHGIHTIDTGYYRDAFDAAFLVVERGRGAFIDTGTNHGVPRLLETLAAAGLSTDDVDWLIATHVHLDHAGGAGLLMQSLPNARLVVHPRGARHLIDPAALTEGARAVYGDEAMQRHYGIPVPVPADRVLETSDGMTLAWGGRTLQFIDTPGHARHHHCVWDDRSRSFFTGDTFGLSYREFDTDQGAFILPTTSPVQFEPEALKASIARIAAYDPEAVYLAHYGRVTGVQRLAAMLLPQIDEMVAIGRAAPAGPQRHEALKHALARAVTVRLRTHGCTLADERIADLLAMDLELNAQGLGVWLDRQAGGRG